MGESSRDSTTTTATSTPASGPAVRLAGSGMSQSTATNSPTSQHTEAAQTLRSLPSDTAEKPTEDVAVHESTSEFDSTSTTTAWKGSWKGLQAANAFLSFAKPAACACFCEVADSQANRKSETL